MKSVVLYAQHHPSPEHQEIGGLKIYVRAEVVEAVPRLAAFGAVPRSGERVMGAILSTIQEPPEIQESPVEQKLWYVRLRAGSSRYNPCYVVAPDPSSAYRWVRNTMDEQDCGFEKERELQAVELLAEDIEYTNISRLLLPD